MKLARLFWELFKISLFVVGGGYAIIIVADDVFGRRLKWLREGELLDHLSVFQMVPGLIAGNAAIYVGLKVAGRVGAAVGLAAVALPSFLIFLGVSCGYSFLPVENPIVSGALLGLRAALTGIVFGMVAKGWRGNVSGVYGYVAWGVATALLVGCGVNVVWVILAAMAAGIAARLCGVWDAAEDGAAGRDLAGGIPVARLGWLPVAGIAAGLVALTVFWGRLFWLFVKFGLLCFGGGFVLVPLYLQEFVGPQAPLLQIPVEEFSNLMALTQATPGPVSVNAATFFGYRTAGVSGAAVATLALLLPSFFLLALALGGLDRWRSSRVVQGLLRGVRPATTALMVKAGVIFAGMSVWTRAPAGDCGIHPAAVGFALFAGWMLMRRRLSILATIFLCAAGGALAAILRCV